MKHWKEPSNPYESKGIWQNWKIHIPWLRTKCFLSLSFRCSYWNLSISTLYVAKSNVDSQLSNVTLHQVQVMGKHHYVALLSLLVQFSIWSTHAYISKFLLFLTKTAGGIQGLLLCDYLTHAKFIFLLPLFNVLVCTWEVPSQESWLLEYNDAMCLLLYQMIMLLLLRSNFRSAWCALASQFLCLENQLMWVMSQGWRQNLLACNS